jgi:hypothetical protein
LATISSDIPSGKSAFSAIWPFVGSNDGGLGSCPIREEAMNPSAETAALSKVWHTTNQPIKAWQIPRSRDRQKRRGTWKELSAGMDFHNPAEIPGRRFAH